MINIQKVVDKSYLFFLTLMLIAEFVPIFGVVFKIGIVCILLIYLCVFLNRNRWKLNQKFYSFWVILFLFYFYLSSFWSIRPILCYWVILQALMPILVMTFTMCMYAKDRNKVYHLLAVYYVAAVVMLIYVILKLDLSALAGQRVTDAMETDSPDSWNSNSIGLTLATAIYCGYLLKARLNKIYRLIFYVATIVMLYGIMLTGSRKSLIILFIPIFYFGACNLKKHFFKILISAGLTLVAAYFIVMEMPFFYEIIGKRMEDLFNIMTNETNGTEDVSRVMLIIYGWSWFLEHPFLGVGVNNFRALSNTVPLFAGKNFYAHNNYIETLVGCGLFGFFLYYSAHFYLLKHSLRLHTSASKWVVSFIGVTLFIDMAMVSYYDLMTHYFLIINTSLNLQLIR